MSRYLPVATWLGALLWCLPFTVAARAPELPAPPEARVVWVAQNMRYNTLPMAIRQFTTKDALARVLDFYRHEWDDGDDEKPGYVINDLAPPWVSISRIEDDYLLMVQAQVADDGGTFGYLSVGRLPTRNKAPELGRGFPTPGETRTINEIVSEDGGQTGRTMMFVNKHDLPSNLSFYRSRYTNDGWIVDMDKGIGDTLHVLAVHRGRQRVDLVLAEIKRGVTRIIVNEVTQGLL